MKELNQSYTRVCTRCSTSFACKPEAIQECDCRKIHLTFEETQFIAKQFRDCVCNSCLLELKEEYHQQVSG